MYDTQISSLYKLKTGQLSLLSIIGIAIVHIGVSVGVIGINTFIPAQLALIGWETPLIAFIVGITTLFEVGRLAIGYLGDNFPLFGSTRRHYVILGLIIQTTSLIAVSQLLGSIFIMIGMIGFVIGSAIVATMSDAYLLDHSNDMTRGKTAGAIQFFRLFGYAVGGIFGAIYYGKLQFEGYFIGLGILSILIGVLPVFLIKDQETPLPASNYSMREKLKEGRDLVNQLVESQVILMSLFLLFFLIGLFAQDAVLEPFAVELLAFSEGNIGRIAAIWGTTTLIFIPLALFLEKYIGTTSVILLGIAMSSIGLLVVAFIGLQAEQNLMVNLSLMQNIFLISIAIFGAGAGLVTTPSTALMLKICSDTQSRTFLLAFFGLISTFGRAIGSLIAGVIMIFESFPLLFGIEIGFLIMAFGPYLLLKRGGFDGIQKPREHTG